MHSSYGLATKVTALPGKHDSMVELLLKVSRVVFSVPGCLSYVVSTLPAEPDAVFIAEFWGSHDDQRAAFAMAHIFELANEFHALAAHVEQYELTPLTR